MAQITGTISASIDDASLPKGDPGAPGLSAYEIWQLQGNTGTIADFLASLKGEPGLPGTPGLPGPIGTSGLKTVLDFAAKGDNDADDAPAFNAALAWAEANEQVVVVPNLPYKIMAPIAVTTTRDHVHKWGLMGSGARLTFAYAGTVDDHLISIKSRHTSRFLTLTGLTLKGTRTAGSGIYLAAREVDGATGNLYNSYLADLAIEGFQNGLQVNGECFESIFTGIFSRDNAQDGFWFGHGKDPVSGAQRGVCSAIYLNNFVAGQNGRYGVTSENFMTDLTVETGYILLNQSYGLHLGNGSDKGVSNVGFENNYLSTVFTEESAHIFTCNFAALHNIKAHNGMAAGAKYLVLKSSTIAGDMQMSYCRKSRSASQAQGLARLRGTGHTYLQNCAGDLTVETPALYTADFCAGGTGLSTTGRVSNVPAA